LIGSQTRQDFSIRVKQHTGRRYQPAGLAIEHQRLGAAFPFFDPLGQTLEIVRAGASCDWLHQNLHPPAADQPIIPTVIAVELKRAHFWSILSQQSLMFVIFVLSVLGAYLLVNRVSQPLNQLTAYVKQLAARDFSLPEAAHIDTTSLPLDSKDEIGDLATSFLSLERDLQQSIEHLKATTAAKERIESELKIARDIQMSLLPRIFPPFPHRTEFELYATIEPAREVGGDFYDFFLTADGRLCFAIGDVSGKGVPASLFMAVTQALWRIAANKHELPDQALAELNAESLIFTLDGDFRIYRWGRNRSFELLLDL
jgi:HAMP domain-containing protein